MAIALKIEQTNSAVQTFFAYLKSELSMSDRADDYDLLPGESTGVFRISSFGLDTRPNRTSGSNRAWYALDTSILLIQGVSAPISDLASAQVAGIISNLPNVVESFSMYPAASEGFYEVRWDQRRITPVPRSPLYNQTEEPRWIVNIVFGAVLYFTQAKTPQGIYK